MGKDFFKIIKYGGYLVFVRLKGIKLAYLKKFKGHQVAEEYIRKTVYDWSNYSISKALKMNVTIEGRENIPEETCVFIGNHTSMLDIPLLIVACDRRITFIAKKELEKVPVFGYWIKSAKGVLLDRENARAAIKVINEGVENVKSGINMAIFPEGTRSKNGELGEFKKGSMKLATKAKAPIVPVAIDRAYRAFEIDKKFKAIDIKISFGKPIYTADISKEEEKVLHLTVRSAVEDLLKDKDIKG